MAKPDIVFVGYIEGVRGFGGTIEYARSSKTGSWYRRGYKPSGPKKWEKYEDVSYFDDKLSFIDKYTSAKMNVTALSKNYNLPD